MADCYAAKITIGGSLPIQLVDEFIKKLEAEEVALSWSDFPADAVEIRNYIQNNDGPLVFVNGEAVHGEFTGVEQFCKDHNLAFCRHNSAHGEVDCQLEWFDPNGLSGTVDSNEAEEVLIPLEEIGKIMQGPSATIRKRLEDLLAVKVPVATPRFSLVQ